MFSYSPWVVACLKVWWQAVGVSVFDPQLVLWRLDLRLAELEVEIGDIRQVLADLVNAMGCEPMANATLTA